MKREKVVKAYQVIIKYNRIGSYDQTWEPTFEVESQLFAKKENCLMLINEVKGHLGYLANRINEIDIEDKYVYEGYFENDAAVEWGSIKLGDLDLDNFTRKHPDRKIRMTIEFLD